MTSKTSKIINFYLKIDQKRPLSRFMRAVGTKNIKKHQLLVKFDQFPEGGTGFANS